VASLPCTLPALDSFAVGFTPFVCAFRRGSFVVMHSVSKLGETETRECLLWSLVELRRRL
jgi:hypothetical protein